MSYRSKQDIATHLQQAASRYIDRAVRVAADIMENDEAKDADRMSAVKWLTDRAAGKASQELIIDVPDTEELDARMEVAQRQTREVLLLPPPVEEPLDNVVNLRPKKRRVRVKD
jgi:hypothetical protein